MSQCESDLNIKPLYISKIVNLEHNLGYGSYNLALKFSTHDFGYSKFSSVNRYHFGSGDVNIHISILNIENTYLFGYFGIRIQSKKFIGPNNLGFNT